MSTSIGYVKLKGTCVTCKKKKGGADPLIKKGELYWTRDTGQFPIKFHFVSGPFLFFDVLLLFLSRTVIGGATSGTTRS